ncbi:ATP-grasp domain-containing protein [Streptomyces chitinivorans]|uniref:ATP-grasp domain-containing protein n=1 Tax=Streptomyces chitinivorans TaxID=1257027 RepID=A0ABW7I206_9ACTN|nr:ATP-grasp domain-containing protein [Streptomyces chitinivorans]MDH2407859.1 ATP-grasp domain-containing protein [Streptomyces chitinivorans]
MSPPLDTEPLDTEVPVLLLRLDRNPFHHGTLGAIRSLGRAGVEVHAVVESPHCPIGRSRYLRQGHQLPADGVRGTHRTGETVDAGGASDDRLERTLRQISDRIGRPAVLIPMDDMGAIAAARLAGRLAGRFLLPEQPPELPQRVADKARLAAMCAELDIPHPPTVIPRSAGEAAAAARELGLPLIAKWSRPWLLPQGGTLRSTTVVATEDQARALYRRSGEAGSRLLLQRLVPGGRDTDWFFHGCFTGGAVRLAGGAGRKERSWPLGAGLTAVGRWLPNPEVERAARLLAEYLDYRGILDLDFRFDAATGTYRLLDFNPRPGAQFRLFTDRSGLDVVRALHLDLTGRTPAPADPLPGRLFVAENYALLSSLAALPCEGLPLTAARRGRRAAAGDAEGVGEGRREPRETETAWFAADDPAPFLAMTASWLGQGGRKAAVRLGRRLLRPGRPAVREPAPEGTGGTGGGSGLTGAAGAPLGAPRTPADLRTTEHPTA